MIALLPESRHCLENRSRFSHRAFKNDVSLEYITVKIVATNERFSKTGIFRRYEEQKAAKGYGRFSEISSHDAAYTGMLITIDALNLVVL